MLRRLLRFFACSLIEDVEDQETIANSLVATEEPSNELEALPAEETEEATSDLLGTDDLGGEDDDLGWLPTEQEKVFSPETIERYAKRYPELLAQLTNPNTPEKLRQQVRQILHDKLNGDILLAQQEEEVEERPEPVEVRQEPPKLPTRKEWFAAIQRQVREAQDPQIAKEFFNKFNKVWGLSDEQVRKLYQDNPRVAEDFTELLSVMAVNLIKTHVVSLVWNDLARVLEKVYPGFGEMYERSSNILAWDRVRNLKVNGARPFLKLPSFGTAEFATRARAAAIKHFGSDEDFEHAQFSKVVNGQRVTLSPSENSEKKYLMLARIMAGQQVDPSLIQAAVRTGERRVRRQQAVRQSGRLGAGTTRGQGTPEGGDDLFGDGLRIYQREHGRL